MISYNRILRMFLGCVALAVLGVFSSCNVEDASLVVKALPDGEYPLSLTASVGKITTRSAGKDAWTQGDVVGVCMGMDGRVAKYVIGSDNLLQPATDEETLYWKDTNPTTITAWYPFDLQEGVDISNQKSGFAAYDVLKAVAENQNYQNSTRLVFRHQMAKVKCRLIKGKGLTDEEFARVVVQVYGYTRASFVNGTLSGTSNGWISMTDDKEALVIPQDMTGQEFLMVSVDGKKFCYTPSNAALGSLLAGYQYVYAITVNDYGIDVDNISGGEWMELNVGDLASAKLIASYSETDLKPGDYYYSDGTWSDGGVRKLYGYVVTEGCRYIYDTIEKEKVDPLADKKLLGIVFFTGQHPYDHADYSNTGIGQKHCRGYVIAMSGVMSNGFDWGPIVDLGLKQNGDGENLHEVDWDGFNYTRKIIDAVGGIGNLSFETEGYPAAYFVVVDYQQQVQAPANSSGWFLPSYGQLLGIHERMGMLNGSLANDFGDYYFYSSTEWSESSVYMFNFYRGNSGVTYKNGIMDSSHSTVPVLAF